MVFTSFVSIKKKIPILLMISKDGIPALMIIFGDTRLSGFIYNDAF